LDRRQVWKTDGHASVKGLLRVVTNRAPWEVTALVQTAKLVTDRPEVAEAMAAGELGVAQAHLLAKTRAHPRCGDKYADVADVLLAAACALPYRDLETVVGRFVSVADEDGADDRAEANHANRDAFFHVGPHGFHGEIVGGTLQGEAAKEIFDRFVQAEFDKDWAAVQKQHGAAAHASLMPRTAAQRRFDAFMAVFEQAVSTPPGSVPPEPVVNVLTDPVTFARILARVFGIEPQPCPDVPLEQRRCETANGHVLAPVEVAAAILAGHVRRVVCDSAGVVIDLGRKQRLFTGNARVAAHMGIARCIWPGCDTPAARCQTDHLTPWSESGTTSPDDGAPCCPRHNLFKHNRGYWITRDRAGGFHVHRPDGTEIR
jgi:hypothetical protein